MTNELPDIATPIRSDLADQSLRPHLDAYLRSLHTRIAEIVAALANNDREQLITLFHNLKGTGGLYGLMPITTAAAHIEQLLLADTPFPELAPHITTFIATLHRIEGFPAPNPESKL